MPASLLYSIMVTQIDEGYVYEALDENSGRYNQIDKTIATMVAHALRRIGYRLVETALQC
jgi:hypothetical protein